MAQITMYVDEETLRRIGNAAEVAQCSVSKWVKRQLIEALDQTWPEGYFEVLGSLRDLDLERPTEPSWQSEAPRERL